MVSTWLCSWYCHHIVIYLILLRKNSKPDIKFAINPPTKYLIFEDKGLQWACFWALSHRDKHTCRWLISASAFRANFWSFFDPCLLAETNLSSLHKAVKKYLSWAIRSKYLEAISREIWSALCFSARDISWTYKLRLLVTYFFISFVTHTYNTKSFLFCSKRYYVIPLRNNKVSI